MSHEVVVVGNGSLGLSLGLVLARRGVRVAVLGQPHRPAAASAAAGAMIGTFGEVTTTLLGSDYGRTKLDWAYQASKLWPDWLESISPDTDGSELLTADGTVVMLNSVGLPEIDTENYKAIRRALGEYDEKFEDVDPDDIEWLDPEPTARPLQAMFLPNEHAVNAHELLIRLDQAFAAAGGVQIPQQAVGVTRDGDRVTGVTLADGTALAAEQVVLAAGAATQAVLDTLPDQAAVIPRLISGYGVSALVDTVDGQNARSVIRTPNRAFACGLHVVPRGPGQVYVGATNVISPEPRTKALVSDVLFLMDCGVRQVRRNLARSPFRKLQVGNRPVALDGMPLLGQTGVAGLWMMTGTYRDGLTLSPLLAREMAALLVGEPSAVDLELFAPVRRPIQPFQRADIVNTTVTHMMATGYETNWTLPAELPLTIEHYLRLAYTRIADEFDPEFTPPPELLAASRIHLPIAQSLRDYYSAV
ncbi:FAD-binding oxidoreductase [Kribbella sandramycini]|uniref:FAD-binding oxidoreductase n=1 Tax=Kribbella sandramycini TaxID=60450 RepID=A0A7Y4P0K0_9ACTN|nr:glycine/D-amino acid oxidase-like deaminating enzyme [Kribbella sandramycini]NOL42741.1 FAD-binding oxidoreductase [Kribbella sandramycini]